jgi:Xaa-Pro aminopeptidase
MAIDSERHSRTIASLINSPYDAFVCSSATEVLLLTGYWPVMGESIAIASSDGEINVIVPEDEVELAEKTTAAKVISYKPAGLDSLMRPVDLLKDALARVIRNLLLSRATIGLQLDAGVQPSSYAVSMQFRSGIAALLRGLAPDATVSACDEWLEVMKAVKTPKELSLMRTATQVAAAGFSKASAYIQAGSRETEVAAVLQAAFESTSIADGLERSYGYFFCMSGPNSAKADAAYARTRQRLLQKGDLVMIHANTCADGYWTDLTRTYTVGEPSDRQHEIHAAICHARAAGLASIRPGVRGDQVDQAVRAVMEARGFGSAFKHASGHGVGFAAANPNGRPRIHPLSPDVLEAGMTFNLEPAAYFEGYGGMRHCDLIAVTADGATVMSDF